MTFRIRLYKCFLDAAVSEQIARRLTMSAATENADDMIKSLSMQYNKARQAQITKEIAEVIGGATEINHTRVSRNNPWEHPWLHGNRRNGEEKWAARRQDRAGDRLDL